MTPHEPPPTDTLATLAALVETRSGLRFVGSRQRELGIKLSRAFAESGRSTWQEYAAELADPRGIAVLDQLVQTLTIGETYFYRHRAFFEMLEREILPEIIRRRSTSKHVRVWCAGCASGEEAYSLAIAVRRLLPNTADWHVNVLATDLNRAFLDRAEAGVYSEWSFRETDAAFKAEYFVPDGSRHRIRPELREMVRFAQLNLAEDGYPSPANGTTGLDLILCRNVLLYFGPELVQQVVDRMRAALGPGGWLMLGPSDPRPGRLMGFAMHAIDGAIAYRRVDETPTSGPTESPSSPGPEPAQIEWTFSEPAPVAVAKVEDAPWWREAWLAARTSADAGALEPAEVQCRQAIAAAPDRPEPYYLLGSLLQTRGDDDASLAAFRKALFVDPTFVPALLAQAAQYRRGGAHERCRQALKRAQRMLDGRDGDELVLAEDGLTVGRLRDAIVQALDEPTGVRG